MCQTGGGQRTSEASGCNCGCCGCGCGGSFRRFISAEEEQERLEGYRDQLQKELAGVEKYIKELKGK